MQPDRPASHDHRAVILVLLAVATLLAALSIGYDAWQDTRPDGAAMLDSD